MTRAPAAVFVILVAATFGAFFLAQRLKHEPTLIQRFGATPIVSPNHDGRKDAAHVGFTVKRPDDVTLAVVDGDGDVVRELLSRKTHRNRQRIRATWDGRDAAGRIVPDGIYRYRITLLREGRGIIYPRDIRVDTTPPRPRVVTVGEPVPGPPRPAILPRPDGSPVPIAVDARGAMLRVLVYRTWPDPALAAELPVPPPDRPAPRERWTRPVRVAWDGREGGAPARAGTYVVVAEVRDDAGNIGRSAPLGRDDLPEAGYGQALPGHSGVTVRYAAVEPPAEAVVAGRSAAFGVDTRQRPYRWSLRRLGHGRPERTGRMPPRRRGRVVPVGGTRRVAIPARERSGVLLFGVASGLGSARVPVAVQGAGNHPVLVVLPVMTWQGRNHVDDDGDGAPNLLEHGDSARVHRVYAGLPATFAGVTAPLLAWLDRTGRRYDLTTDVALARGEGRGLEGHRGVVLAGDTRWLPVTVQRALRRYVQAGGKVATVGADNLRRLVRLTAGDVLVRPTPPATFDALGLRPGALLRGDLTLTNAKDDAGLFTGTSGQFTGLTVAEPVAGVRGGSVESSAVTADGRTVIAAVRSGDGLVIHLGLPELPSRLGAAANDPQAVALLQSTWTLLSR